MKKEEYDIIDETSRPGYVQIRVKETGKTLWARINNEPDPPGTEYGELSHKQLVALGLIQGMKTKSFSEMTEEEQKLFIDNDNT